MPDKIEAVIRHEISTTGSPRAESAVSSDLLRAIEKLTKSLEPVMKRATTVGGLAAELRGTRTGGENTVIGRPEANRIAFNRIQNSVLAYHKLTKDVAAHKPSEMLLKQFESFQDLNRVQKSLFNSTGAVNRSLKAQIKLFAREVRVRRTIQKIQQDDIRRARLMASGGLATRIVMQGLGVGLLTAGGRAFQQVAGVQAAYEATVPLTRASETGKMMIAAQNQIRKGLAEGVTAALAGAGLLIGGPAGAAIGAVIGTIYSAHVAAANAATSKAYQVGRVGARAYFTAEPVGTKMMSTKIAHSRYHINLPQNLQKEYQQTGLSFMAPFVETNPAFRQMGMNLQPTSTIIKHLANLRSTGINTQAMAKPLAFLTSLTRSQHGDVARRGDEFVNSVLGTSGGDVLNSITRLSRKTGIDPQQMASMVSSLVQTTGLATPKAAGQFITATTPFGGGFQHAALQYQQAGPLEKFKRNMMMKAFFSNVNASQLFGGTAAQITHQRLMLKKDVSEMDKKSGGLPLGSILAEKALQGGQNFYGVMNAPTPSPRAENRATEHVSPTDWSKTMGEAIKEALSSVHEMRVGKLVVADGMNSQQLAALHYSGMF